MEEASFLQDLVVTLTAALFVLLPSRRLRIPAAVGFMLTGILIGPGGLGLIGDPHHVQVLAEVGVAILLFMIGLEFSTARLREIGRAFFLGGSLQVVGTIAVGAALVVGLSSGTRLGTAVFVGMLLALSSTAMVLRIFVERGEHHAPQGRLVLGILLFQDFAMVPMLLLVPSLAGTGTLSFGPRLLIGAASALAVWLAARFLMPRVVGAVVRSGVRELYAMMAVAVCLGAALATQSLGLSPALGAFLAGLLVSESEYSHQIVAEVLPFRDLFSSVFFISIGMLLVPDVIWSNLPATTAILAAVILIKAGVAAGAVRLMGYPARIAVVVGLSLAQVGEFSFVLSSVGVAQGLLSETAAQIFLAVAVVTLMLTPFMIHLAAWAGSRAAASPALPHRDIALAGHVSGGPVVDPEDEEEEGLSNHVVIAGYGLNGRNVARVLRELGIPYVALEVDPAIVRRARSEGEKIEFGDASKLESLRTAGVHRAAIVVAAISDPTATRFTVLQARRSNPGAYVIARTRLVREVAELMRLGADEVIPEEFETSIAILGRVLRRFHVPLNVIRIQEQALRREGYSFLRGADAETLTTSVSRLISGATTDTFYLEPESPAVDRTIAQLDLHGATRALIIAVVRDGAHTVSPDSGFTLRAGDILVLVGDHQALEDAFERLNPPRPG